MGFDLQNANEPIVNVHKRTTKVNFAVVIAVVVFLLIGIGAMIWVSNRSERGEPVREDVQPRTGSLTDEQELLPRTSQSDHAPPSRALTPL